METHAQAGKKVVVHPKAEHQLLVEGAEYTIQDYWKTVGDGTSWMDSAGNIACVQYAVRAGTAGLPLDDEVVYGKIGPLGYLVHVTELGKEITA